MKRFLSPLAAVPTALFIATLSPAPLTAAEPPRPTWQDETQLHAGTEPPAATMVRFTSGAQAVTLDKASSPLVRSLNGQWKFAWVAMPADRIANFWKPGFDDSA